MSRAERSTKQRHELSMNFLDGVIPDATRVLDLGTRNALSEMMAQKGHTVFNTSGEDLDLNPETVSAFDVEVVTAFEIFEHLLSPLPVLQQLPAKKLVVTVPLRLWFSPAYRSTTDPWDRHYHEFEDWQFDWLLEKAGWKIIKRERWNGLVDSIGIRPLLRKMTPRFYAVYAERD